MNASSSSSRTAAWWRPILLALPLLLYCLLATRNYYWDGVAFAIDIEKHPLSSALLYPSHLIYEPFGGWLYRLSQLAGFETRALFLMQGANCVLAGASVFLLDKCLRRRSVAPEISAAWALLFGFSATWWRFATDADAYVPAVLLLLCADILMDRPAMAGLCAAAAMLFHELAALFLVVALVRLPRRKWLEFLAAALVPVVLVYWIAFRSSPGGSTAGGFLSWITWHSPDSSFSFHPLNNLMMTLRGTLRLFFGGRFAEFIRDGISMAALAALAVAILAFLASLVNALRGSPSPFRTAIVRERPATDLLIWLGIYLAFLFFWMPQNTFYRLFYLAPAVMLLAKMLPPGASLVWLFTAVMALWNFTFLAYPQSRPQSNAPLAFALAYKNAWPTGTPIVYRTFHPDLWTISYFNQQAAWIGLAEPRVDRLNKLLDDARAAGHPLWMEETAYLAVEADPAGRRWLESHESRGELAQFEDGRHDFRFHCLR